MVGGAQKPPRLAFTWLQTHSDVTVASTIA
jgi:hypothetical protein